MHRYTPHSVNLPDGLAYELVEAPQEGQWRADLPVSQHRYGVIATVEPIPPHQLHHFDLQEL
jgi:hypothetical protein